MRPGSTTQQIKQLVATISQQYPTYLEPLGDNVSLHHYSFTLNTSDVTTRGVNSQEQKRTAAQEIITDRWIEMIKRCGNGSDRSADRHTLLRPSSTPKFHAFFLARQSPPSPVLCLAQLIISSAPALLCCLLVSAPENQRGNQELPQEDRREQSNWPVGRSK